MPAWAEGLRRAAAGLALGAGLAAGALAQTSDLVAVDALRVCADPANAPMSSEDGSGYENVLAELIAEKLGVSVTYEWYPMSTGFIRNTLRDKKCDVVIGYAQGHELVLNTNHYMTSVYTLIVPAGGDLAEVETLADPRLKGRRIGIVAGTPPGAHLARHGLIARSRGYPLIVDRRHQSPAQDMLADLEAGEIDAAILWGPLGGPLVKRAHPGLKVIPMVREEGAPRLFYRITMGVRQGEKVWQRKLNSLIRRHQGEIDALLHEAGVPLANDMGTALVVPGP
ncbi:substrate-binding domain-containing protein [Roseovarius autotrophicus]|uniref:substrate-binding domain-containing protein n=1 Tax=Roseovarius autotrophicus TaxID=2824121 RepID=UPI001FFCB107